MQEDKSLSTFQDILNIGQSLSSIINMALNLSLWKNFDNWHKNIHFSTAEQSVKTMYPGLRLLLDWALSIRLYVLLEWFHRGKH